MEIIAELAQGFEGKPEQALLLMKAAHSAGADAVKYQLVYADELATEDYKYFDLFRSLEMDDSRWQFLADQARELGIRLQLDIFGAKGLGLAERIGVTAVKLHGTDISNTALLEQVAASALPRVLLGAGGAYWGEIQNALAILRHKEVVVLLGFQGYPTQTEDNEISRVRLMIERLSECSDHVTVGFADHAQADSPLRFALSAMALGAGATVLEKHLTLGRCMKLEDFESALNPDEFSEYVETLRACALAGGQAKESDDFGMSTSEARYRQMIRRHVVSAGPLAKGTKLQPTDLVLKRSSAEFPITSLQDVYGKVLCRDVVTNSPLSIDDFV